MSGELLQITQEIVFQLILAAITRFRKLEKVKCLGYTIRAELDSGEEILSCLKGEGPVRLDCKQKEFVKKLKDLQREAAQPHVYLENPDKWEGWALNISDRKTCIRKTLQSFTKRNRELNKNDEVEYI